MAASASDLMLDPFSLPSSVSGSDNSDSSEPSADDYNLSSTNPEESQITPEILKAHAKAIGYVAIPTDTYQETLRAAHQPTIEEIQRRLLVWA